MIIVFYYQEDDYTYNLMLESCVGERFDLRDADVLREDIFEIEGLKPQTPYYLYFEPEYHYGDPIYEKHFKLMYKTEFIKDSEGEWHMPKHIL